MTFVRCFLFAAAVLSTFRSVSSEDIYYSLPSAECYDLTSVSTCYDLFPDLPVYILLNDHESGCSGHSCGPGSGYDCSDEYAWEELRDVEVVDGNYYGYGVADKVDWRTCGRLHRCECVGNFVDGFWVQTCAEEVDGYRVPLLNDSWCEIDDYGY
ncbi:hypothetical protein Pan14r_25300 [Crateriforma conspicua]|uniref:Uncharacterized protein n=1 Tax=Crateriforma conspicua TaxID=2527996 RepID=A0A5C5Y5M5_9PLAN|nr:hypothetical protein Mal65_39960 [Crateriforma conspicua]TWT70229.1 hypothetical protein Pan14r_25300 [Crateriforma conspicua]